MRIAIIADIHANLTALDAALADIEALRPDQVVCLGDVAALGPQPRQVVERLRALGCPVVMGNADAWLLDPPVEASADENTRRFEDIDRWCAAQLAPTDLAFLRAFAPTVELPLGDRATLLCFHGSPQSYDDIIVATTPDDELARMLGGCRATVLAGGHTHAQMLRRYQEMTVLNPGSVGLSFEYNSAGSARNPPWAEYAVVDWARGRLSVELRRVPFDAGALAQAAFDSGMPHAEWWARDWRIE
jgi:predicted phosphodiesterase